MSSMRTTTEVFEDHLAKRLDNDIEGDIKTNYSPKVIFLTGTGAFHGHEGVRKSAGELAEYLGDAKFEYRHTLVDDDYAFLEWTATSSNKDVLDGADGFVIKNGKIIMQTIHYSVSRHKE
ncbi:MAG TPA: nuclear transport factor 2 family protein [Candidatus Saccharimonadales bacterium]|nr:nuclear transport factor 2 family protein [Candidatus Saccharimonadales bacterium]